MKKQSTISVPSPRLRQVLHLIVQGYSDAMIAQELVIALRSAEAFVARVKRCIPAEFVQKYSDQSSRIALTNSARDYLAYLLHNEAEKMAKTVKAVDTAGTTDTVVEVIKVEPTEPLTVPSSVPSGGHFDPYVFGTNLIAHADELVQRYLWEQAMENFRYAERVLGRGSTLAAIAGCGTVQMYIELGDYDTAQQEATRVESAYASIMDPETKVRLYKLRGWLDYYQGNFPQAEGWFNNCLILAAESVTEQMGEAAQHFLGCLYLDWGKTVGDRKNAEALFHKATSAFGKAYQLHSIWGEDYRAYDWFRKAQLRSTQGYWEEARQLRDTSRQMFGGDLAYLNIDLEEARLELADGDTQTPKRKAERALEGWAEVRHPIGMSDGLQLLGRVEYMQGNVEEALNHYVAALCVFPFEKHVSNTQLWTRIKGVARRQDSKSYRKWLRRMQESAEDRTGPFSYLDSVIADRSADVTRVFDKMNSLRS